MHPRQIMWPFTRRKTDIAPDAPAEIRELLDLLERLRSRSRNDASLELEPCLSAEQISEFEATHKINLPDDYRNFLRFAGNGGAGPDFGLIPLEGAVPSLSNSDVDLLATPFIHTSAITSAQFNHIDERDPFWDTYYSDRLIAGCLRLVDSGCGRGKLIVVNGPAAGTIWFDNRDSGVYPLNIRFCEWYRTWLLDSIKSTARVF